MRVKEQDVTTAMDRLSLVEYPYIGKLFFLRSRVRLLYYKNRNQLRIASYNSCLPKVSKGLFGYLSWCRTTAIGQKSHSFGRCFVRHIYMKR
jgi:hypothetical protein